MFIGSLVFEDSVLVFVDACFDFRINSFGALMRFDCCPPSYFSVSASSSGSIIPLYVLNVCTLGSSCFTLKASLCSYVIMLVFNLVCLNHSPPVLVNQHLVHK